MDRQSSTEPTIAKASSIALLQERFRKLERAREMRRQRQLFRVFPEADHEKSDASSPSIYFRGSRLIVPDKPALIRDSSLQLQYPTMQPGQYAGFRVDDTPNLANLHSSNVLMYSSTDGQYKCDESDVDTSLHL